LYDKYKATRPSEKPNYFYEMLKAMIKEFGLVKVDGYEADDLCASCAKWCRLNKIEYVVCNIDFDLQQIPGYHYTWDNKSHWGKEVFHVIDEYEAMYNLAKQFFKSQASDNIKVCKGIGDVAIVKILSTCKTKFSFMKQIVNVYKNGFGRFKGYDNYREMITLIYNLVYLKEDIEYDYQSTIRKV
jgi:5'-3' exonuclease